MFRKVLLQSIHDDQMSKCQAFKDCPTTYCPECPVTLKMLQDKKNGGY